MRDLVTRVREAHPQKVEQRYSLDTWIQDYLLPTVGGWPSPVATKYLPGLQQTAAGQRIAEVAASLPGYSRALRGCPPAFAAQLVRALVLSQARFVFRNPPWHSSTPRRRFGTKELGLLERPWRNATTGELLARMEWHAGLAGNAYVVRQNPVRLRVLRPDWVGVVFGSQAEPDDPAGALDGEILGYAYANGGLSGGNKVTTLLPDEVAHWAPIPDPESAAVGVSWVSAAVQDMRGDMASTQHKLMFFQNGATPNLVVKGIPAATPQQFTDIVDKLESQHAGIANAYKTLYLTAGADATVVGSDFKQMDFKATQGAGETRISFLSRVPAAILGIAEGLAGSSLNAGNFGMARRIFADTWVYPTLQDVSSALASIINVPADSELWFDTADIPLLREDAKDAAEIEQIKASTIRQYVDGGFDPGSAVAAVDGQDVNLLKHSGMLSVQLQAPGQPMTNGRKPVGT